MIDLQERHILNVLLFHGEQNIRPEDLVNLFRSDFREVARYFVQMRENGEYCPSDDELAHMDVDIMRYYIEKFGAIELPREHPFSIGFTGNATTRIREAYNYVWTEDNS